MTEDHWGLTGRPFQLTPDPAFWFATATHRKAMAYLGYGLAQGEGFLVVTGDIGAGKTTLMGHLLATIDRQDLHVVQLVSTAIDASELLRAVATQLGVEATGLSKAALLTAIERGLHAVARSGRRTLVVVDEAQALPVETLEELRMLSNFQAGGHALTQIVLLGQPEFRDRLHGSDRLEQLRQRVIAIHHLDPMDADEIADYVAHRLQLVGWQGRPDWAPDAFPAMYEATAGVPRRVNLLGQRLMLQAAVSGAELIDGAMVAAVREDMEADMPVAAPAAPAVIPALSRDPGSASAAIQGSGTPDQVRGDGKVNGRGDGKVSGRDDGELDTRLAELEARLEAQDAALRRVLTLLVDWVEADPPMARPRAQAA